MAPLRLGVGGSLLTSPVAGAIEADANCIYATTDAGNRGIVQNHHLLRQNAAYTLSNVGTSQRIFNASANGRITLETGVYEFEMLVVITGMSATSGNVTFTLAGTATLGSIIWWAQGLDAASDAATANWSGSYSTDATLVAAPVFTAGTATALAAIIRGTFACTVAGNWQPQVTLQTAVATAAVAAGSYCKIWRIGSSTVTTVGQWD